MDSSLPHSQVPVIGTCSETVHNLTPSFISLLVGEGVNWIHLAQDRVLRGDRVDTIINDR
jgi:hypothetical protein